VLARLASIAVLAGAAAATAGAVAGVGAAAASTSNPPCTPRTSEIAGHRAIAYCGPATVVIQTGGRTYRFRRGLCDLSTTMRGVEISIGTLVRGAAGNGGLPFVAIVIAHLPSSSESFEAFSGGQQLYGESVIAPTGAVYAKGSFVSVLGGSFSGSWDCHGVISRGP